VIGAHLSPVNWFRDLWHVHRLGLGARRLHGNTGVAIRERLASPPLRRPTLRPLAGLALRVGRVITGLYMAKQLALAITGAAPRWGSKGEAVAAEAAQDGLQLIRDGLRTNSKRARLKTMRFDDECLDEASARRALPVAQAVRSGQDKAFELLGLIPPVSCTRAPPMDEDERGGGPGIGWRSKVGLHPACKRSERAALQRVDGALDVARGEHRAREDAQ
jgi:hypothetical protein